MLFIFYFLLFSPTTLSYTSIDGAEFYDVNFNSNLVGGGYNPCIDELFFKDINSIKEAFPEEFIHLFPDVYYHNNYHSGGICIYLGTNAQNNIEFEAKLIQDLINYIRYEQGANFTYGYLGEGPQYGQHNLLMLKIKLQ